MKIKVLSNHFSICRLPAGTPVPAWATASEFWSITKTMDELSVVCETSSVPTEVNSNSGWRALKIEGPLEFSMVGILAQLSSTLANAQVSIFAISTFDTDYLLVREQDLLKSVGALREAGHEVRIGPV